MSGLGLRFVGHRVGAFGLRSVVSGFRLAGFPAKHAAVTSLLAYSSGLKSGSTKGHTFP